MFMSMDLAKSKVLTRKHVTAAAAADAATAAAAAADKCDVASGMYEDLKEYLNWYDTRRDTKFAADAPVIGLVLQRSHLVTGDEGHYSGVVSELEAQGAKVCCILLLLLGLPFLCS